MKAITFNKNRGEHRENKKSRKILASIVVSSFALASFFLGLFLNSETYATWRASSAKTTGAVITSGHLTLGYSPSTLVDVSRWDNGNLVPVSTNVPISSVRVQPRTSVLNTETVTVSMNGANMKARLTCTPNVTGWLSQRTNYTKNGVEVPTVETTVTQGANVIAPGALVQNGSYSVKTRINYPSNVNVEQHLYSKNTLSKAFPTVKCVLVQSR